MNKYLDISPEVQQALAEGKPVVALESTIISHGMPYPKNVETALLVEKTAFVSGRCICAAGAADGYCRGAAASGGQRISGMFG